MATPFDNFKTPNQTQHQQKTPIEEAAKQATITPIDQNSNGQINNMVTPILDKTVSVQAVDTVMEEQELAEPHKEFEEMQEP